MTADLLADAERLSAAGAWDDAIDLLTAANRAGRDDQLERRITDLRHRSWVALTSAEPAPPAPADTAPPPVGESGLPEVSLQAMTAGAVRAALESHGALFVPRALDNAAVESLIGTIERALARVTDPDDLDDHGDSTYYPLKADRLALDTLPEPPQALRRRFVTEAGGVLLADSPRGMFELLELYDSLGLHDVVQDFLGDRPVMSANKCTMRRVEPDKFGGWHQDGAFLGEHIRAINIWLALTDCGVDAPGLDLVADRVDHIVETGTEGSFFDWAVGDPVIERLGAPIVRPRIKAGDMVIFDEMNLHRTATAPGMTLHRHAIEFWCFAASTYPKGHIPLVW
ncbi:MAG: hypothetical protein DHS20C19_03740 [Acidimicrobiales bacterium]|nr:MAG: hypothetical protein DHS20C19_03740 [Acidimicrobiales bacterium]